MSVPKLIIASDGDRTAAVIDGILIGQGIERLDFSTENKNGDKEGTLRILDLNVGRAKLSTDLSPFMKWVNDKG